MASPLEQQFLSGQSSFQQLETSQSPTNSEKFQEQVRSTLKSFISASIHVDKESIFSRNEELDDISTSSIQYGFNLLIATNTMLDISLFHIILESCT